MKEEVIIDIQLNTTQAAKKAAELRVELEKQRKQLAELNKAFKENPSEELAKEINQLNASIKNNTRDLNLNQAASEANDNSINALRASVNQLTKERNALNTKTAEGKARFEELTKTIKGQTDQLKELEKAVGDTRRNVGNYEEAIRSALDGNALFGEGLNDVLAPLLTFVNGLRQMATSLKAATAGLNLFKVALVSTGLGAIVVLLGSLIAFLTQTEKGFRALTRVINFLDGVIGTIINDLTKIGEVLFDFVVAGAKAAVDAFTSLFNLFSGEKSANAISFWDKLRAAITAFSASSPLAAGVLKLLTGALESATKATTGYVEKLIDGGLAVDALREKNRLLTESIRALNTEAAKQQFLAEKNRKLRDDETKSEEERLKFNELVLQAEEKRRNALLAANAAQRQIIENERATRVDGAKLLAEEQDRLAQLEIERLQILEDFEGRTTEVLTEAVSIRKDALLKQVESVKNAADAELLEYENKNAKLLSGEEGLTKALSDAITRRNELQKKAIDAEAGVKAQQAENDIRNAQQLSDALRLIEAERVAAIIAIDKEGATQIEEITKEQEDVITRIKQSSIEAQLFAVEKGTDAELELLKQKYALERDIELQEAERAIKNLEELEARKAEIRAKFESQVKQSEKAIQDAVTQKNNAEQKSTEQFVKGSFAQVQALSEQAKSLEDFVKGAKDLIKEQIAAKIREAVVTQIAKAIGTTPFPANFGIALTAGIALETVLSKFLQFAGGGRVPSGFELPFSTTQGDNTLALLKPGEVVLNQFQQAKLGGSDTFRKIGVPGFANGGVVGRVSEDVFSSANITQAVRLALSEMPAPIVTVKDINTVSAKVREVQVIANS